MDQMKPDAGVLLVKDFNEREQIMLEQGITAANPQLTVVEVFELSHFLLGLCDENMRLFNIRVENGPLRCQCNSLGIPDKEGQA
ncbi:hypothetical protein D3C74_386600 [compost metagenome]